MLAVAGLGNPGKTYEGTRHNAGFEVVDRLSREFSVSFQKVRQGAALASWNGPRGRVIFIKPLTFMNRSGEAVAALLHYYRIPPEQLLVVHDDLDIGFGRIRIVLGGGAGGHRGVQSIADQLKCQRFPRLKLGIGRPVHGEPVEEYVLQRPYPHHRAAFEVMVARGAEAVQAVLTDGIVSAMNLYNRRDPTLET